MPLYDDLQHSPARITRQVLIDLGLGSASGDWPVFVANEPDSPDAAITVHDSGNEGRSDGRSMIDGTLWSHPAVVVTVRAASDGAGWPKAEAIRQALSGVLDREVTVSGTDYTVHCYSGIGNVVSFGHPSEQGKRHLFNVTARLSVLRGTC